MAKKEREREREKGLSCPSDDVRLQSAPISHPHQVVGRISIDIFKSGRRQMTWKTSGIGNKPLLYTHNIQEEKVRYQRTDHVLIVINVIFVFFFFFCGVRGREGS